MSDQPDRDSWRPWHDALNPHESMYQWFKSEIARIEAKFGPGEGHPDMVQLNPTSAGGEVATERKRR